MTDLHRLQSGERWDGDNAEVLRALGWTVNTRFHPPKYSLPNGDEFTNRGRTFKPLDSLDDALRLVPPGMTANMRIYSDGSATCVLTDEGYLDDGDEIWPTAAIALTLAILKAKETPDV